MDIKNWTWRKRISEKSGENTGDHFAPPNKISLGDHLESTSPWADRDPKPRLQASSPGVTFQDTEAKQQAKVAEEAVAGWEKAEAEAESVKRQLEQAVREKASLQDRLSHLDGALKDCTRQVRIVREEQEQKRQELLQKKNKELEKLRLEYEAKLADVGRQLVEAGAENKVMALTLQEQVRATGEMTDAKSRAEAEMRVLQQRMEAFEKERGVLKYEVHVLSKQIQIRNEERDYSKRDIDNLNRQHNEDVKKMNRLEGECQRLRVLVRRKLPGPNALAQMKLEAESLDGEAIRRRNNGDREIELLVERLLSMEEETKMLKEALTQRSGELQSSRMVCAKTATKLSALEAYFDSISRTHGVPKLRLNGTELQRVRENGDGTTTNGTPGHDEVGRADAWASALIAELSQFKKEKLELNDTPASGIDSFMDDFADMERLAASELTTSEKALTELTSKSPTEEAEQQMPVKRKLEFDAQVPETSEEKPEEELRALIARGVEFVEGLARAAGVEEYQNPLSEKTSLLLQEKRPQLGVLWEFLTELLSVVDGLLSEFLQSINQVVKVDSETQTETLEDPATTTAGEDQKVELEMLRVEKLALESHMKIELSKMAIMEGEVGHLKNNNVHLTEQIEQLSAQFKESQQLVEELQTKLSNKEDLVVSEVQNQNQAQSSNGAFMRDVVSRLEQELEEEYKNHSKQQEPCEAAQQDHQPVVEDNRKLRKEQEFLDAEEKLAECQRTILALGKQLKALSGPSPHHSAETSMDSRANSMLSIVRKHSDSEDMEQENLSRRSPLPSFKEDSYGFSPGASPMPRAQFFYGRSQTDTGIREVHDYFSTEDSSSDHFSLASSPMRQRGGSKTKRSTFSRFFTRSSKNT